MNVFFSHLCPTGDLVLLVEWGMIVYHIGLVLFQMGNVGAFSGVAACILQIA